MAITITNLSKQFRRNAIGQSTTLKSELVRWVLRRKRPPNPAGRAIQALTDINLTVPTGHTFGIVGRNGAGKSTLLKLLTGIYTPTAGTIEIKGRVSALLELGAGFHPEFSGRENILINGIILGLSRKEIRERMDEIIDFSEVRDFIDQPVRTYSSGMYMRLAFSVATHVDPDVLIVDEVLAVGDERFARKSRAKMEEFRRRGKTIFLVTHQLDTLKNWCDSAAWLEAGRLMTVGNPEEVVRQYRDALTADERRARVQDHAGPGLPVLESNDGGRVTIEDVRVLDASRSEATTIDPAAGFSVGFHLRMDEVRAPFRLRLRMIRASDGLLVWSSEPSPELRGSEVDGTPLRLEIPRLDPWPGEYRLVIAIHESSVGHKGEQEIGRIRVDPPAGISPLLSLPHHWRRDRANPTPEGEIADSSMEASG